MTMTRLPRRPYVEQVPPPDGLHAVQAAARGRRHRRAVGAAVGGAATVLASVLAVLSTIGPGQDSLRPLPPAIRPTPSASHAPAVNDPAPARHLHTGQVGGGAIGGRHPGAASVAAPGIAAMSPTATRGSRTTSVAATRAPAVRLRVFRSRSTADGAQICAGDVSGAGTTVGSGGVGWCLFATTKKVAHGVQLTLSACRDDTSGGTLTYSTTREVDLAVKRGGRLVWNWAKDHPAAPSAHTRSAAANECWNWQVVWPDITQSGASAGHGRFTFVGTPTAQELAGYPPESIPFQY